ncbi:MAG: BMP family protein [Peptococcaceae bacterium]|nr:BMP family protein [Peptococcaceae bacterium]
MKKGLTLLLAVVLLAGALGGCGQTPAGDAKMRVALILSGPANDQGWNATALEGLKAAEREFDIETAYMENVDIAANEAAYRDYAAQGYDLVIGHGFQFGEPAAKVSGDFPAVCFMATEAASQSDNMASYVMSCEEGAYLMGMLCASMSNTGVIGVVGGFEQPSITKELEAFKLGAREAAPNIQVLEIYINSYIDATLGKEAAMSMVRQNADVLYHVANQAGTGVIAAAQESGILVCGNSYDQNSIAPENIMCSTVYNMPKVITTAVSKAKDGVFEGGVYYLGMADGVVDIADYHGFADKIPQAIQDAVAAKREAIIKGEFKVPLIETPTR